MKLLNARMALWIRMFFLARWLRHYGLQFFAMAAGAGLVFGTVRTGPKVAEVVILAAGFVLLTWIGRWYQIQCDKLEKQRDEYADIVARYTRLLTDELRRPIR